jgi:BirA family biotin operon repressor/biotin-[acetyl-CoA-carboxylase] ligase
LTPPRQRYGRSLEHKGRTGSTNDDARAAAERGVPDGHVVVADAQDAGRGSHGRTWASPPGTDLYLSIVARVPLEPARIPPLTLAVGLGVARAIDELAFTRASIKWPNDVWIGDSKCAGILVETSSTGAQGGAVIIGIGVNVNRRVFPPELEGIATSLLLARGHGADLDREAVMALVLGRVEAEVDRYVAEGVAAITPDVDARLLWRGESVSAGEQRGRLRGLAPGGGVLLEQDDGTFATAVSGTLVRLVP